MRHIAQTDLVQDLRDTGPPRFLVQEARELRQGVEHLFDTVQPPGAKILRQIAEQLTHLPPIAGHIVSADPNPPGSGRQQRRR